VAIVAYARSALPLARTVGKLALFPAVLLPIWLIGLSAFSTIGITPGGAVVLAAASVLFIRFYSRSLEEGSIVADIASKLETNCWIIFGVSVVFLVVQIATWLWVRQFSPTLYAITNAYNHLSSDYLLHLSSHVSFATRIALIIALALVIVFGPILSTRAVRVSRLISRGLDIFSMFLIASLLFSFYGEIPGGLNAARVVLRKEQNEISELYGRAVSQASQQILARAINQVANDDPTLSHPPNPALSTPPPATPGPGDGPPGPEPKPSPRGGGPDADAPPQATPELNDWDREVYRSVIDQDAKRTEDTARDIRQNAKSKAAANAREPNGQPVPEKLSPKITASSASGLTTKIYTFHETNTLPPDINAAQELASVALDATDFPDVIKPAIDQLGVQTISGKAGEELVGVMGDEIFQDALRTLASNFVGDLIAGVSAKVSGSEMLRSYASTFLDSAAGQKLRSAVQGFRGYGVAVTQRLRAYRQSGNDPIVAAAEQSTVHEMQDLIAKAAVYPKSDSFSSNDWFSSSARTKSESMSRDLVAELAKASQTDASVAKKLSKIKDSAHLASRPKDKAAVLSGLLSLARASGFAASNVVLCSCVGPQGPVYSFYTTREMCNGPC
jgi:hypothetical protein